MLISPSSNAPDRPHVLIAGGGVAGLETLLALRALAGDRVDITIVAPELKFVNRAMSVDEPFKAQRVRGIRLQDVAAELGARWHRGALDRIEPEQNQVVTKDGQGFFYDKLVLALGARFDFQWDPTEVLTYRDGRDGPDYRLLLHQLRQGHIEKLAFVKPAGESWLLPLYDLALMTAAECAAHRLSGIELSLFTPEEEPLGIFGNRATEAIRRLLDESGVTLHAASYAEPVGSGWLAIAPGGRQTRVDRIVTTPRLVGPRLRGIRCDRDGFIPTDTYGRVPELPAVFAAGDATTFPVKQGGLAAQEADAVAERIAASVGVEIDPEPFRPILRGLLLTGASPRYLRSEITGGTGNESTVSRRALWWPPNKLAGRYLGPYLSSRTGDAADVAPHDGDGIPVEVELDPVEPAQWQVLADLSVIGPG